MNAWTIAIQSICAKGVTLSVSFTVKEVRDEAILQAVSEALALHRTQHQDCSPAITMTAPHEIPRDVLREAAAALFEAN